MPDAGQLWLFLVAALLLAIIPGPGMFYVAARALAGGRAEGVASSFGTGLGGLAHVAAGSVGLSALVLASAELFNIIKLLGAAYLVWLGLRTFLSARQDSLGGLASDAVGPQRAFREGVFVEAFNPKTAAFFLAFVPQFVDPVAGNVAVQFAMLGTFSVALNTFSDILVAYGAGAIRAGLEAKPIVVRRLREGSGLVIIALGLGLLWGRRPAS